MLFWKQSFLSCQKSIPKTKFSDHLISYSSSLRRSVDKFSTPGGGVKKIGSGWPKLIVWWLWMTTRYTKNKNCFMKDLHWTTSGLQSQWESTPEPPQKMFLVIFQGLRLSLGHFGQQALDSPVSQLQNGVSTSSLPPFIVDLLAFKAYPRSNSFFQWKF